MFVSLIYIYISSIYIYICVSQDSLVESDQQIYAFYKWKTFEKARLIGRL